MRVQWEKGANVGVLAKKMLPPHGEIVPTVEARTSSQVVGHPCVYGAQEEEEEERKGESMD